MLFRSRIAESIVRTTGGRLDVLVIAHQGRDSISDLLQSDAMFNSLEVGEVWQAWTEDPTDDLARTLAARRTKALAAVDGAARQLAAKNDRDSRRVAQQLRGLLDRHGNDDLNDSRKKAKSIDRLKANTGAVIRYFNPGTEPIEIPGVNGLRVYVLGPSREPQMLSNRGANASDNEVHGLAGVDASALGFLAAANANSGNVSDNQRPFDKWFRMPETEAWDSDFFGEHYGFDGEIVDDWRRIETDWLGIAGRFAMRLQTQLNSTSLALAFELKPSGKVLLFPGDPRAENWISWAKQKWRAEDGNATRTVTAPDLLARTDFYKVGRYGSQDVTLQDLGLEFLSSHELTAMLPLDRETTEAKHWRTRFPRLFRRLQKATSGRIIDLQLGIPESQPKETGAGTWASFLASAIVRPNWLDFTVKSPDKI